MKKILFIDGTKGFTPTRLYEKPCGGIISSLTIIPKYLAQQGYEVYVYSAHDKVETIDGVHYIDGIINEPDIVVFNRNTINRAGAEFFKNAKKVWWLHDIVQPTYLEDDGYKHLDSIIALSEYCLDSYMDYYDIPFEKFEVIPNGVDKSVFYPGEKVNRNLLVCASAPVKGLAPLEFTLYNMLRNYPDTELRIYSNQSLHDFENNEAQATTLKRLKDMGAVILDPIPQKQLADVLREANAFLMPNSYPEICSNLLLQSMACGCPVVTSPIGSAEEYVEMNHNGAITYTFPHDMHWWIKEYAALVIEMRENEVYRDKLAKNAPKDILSWDDVCKMWLDHLEEL